MAKNRITIKELAEKAGVSVATISRVFNGNDDKRVGPELRDRVLKLIEKYNYSPSIPAKSLVSGKSNLIGVQVLSVKSPLINTAMLGGIEEPMSKSGRSMLLGVSDGSAVREKRSLKLMLDTGVDGILWMPRGKTPDREIINMIKKANVPAIWLVKDFGHGIPSVTCDELRGGEMLADHLIKQGFRNFAMMYNPRDRDSLQRCKGFRGKVLKEKITDPANMLCKKNEEESVIELTEKMLDENPELDAVACMSDRIAQWVYMVIKDKGKVIGKDIAVTGYADHPFAPFLQPPLTSVAIYREEVGRVAAEIMTDCLDGRTKKMQAAVIEPELIIRGSSCRKRR